MVSYFENRPELARTFIIVQSAFFLLNFERSTALTAFKFSRNENDGKSKRETFHSKFGSICYSRDDCNFEGAICSQDTKTCQCHSELPATNRFDKCGPSSLLNETCDFDEQCEHSVWNSMCRRGYCVCRGNGKPVTLQDGTVKCLGKQFGDSCFSDDECAFKWAICDLNKHSCQCRPDLIATNHLDKCGKVKNVGEECFFNEQCEQRLFDTICIDGKCACRSERTAFANPDGSFKCVVIKQPDSDVRTDPTMIIVLSVMCLMFIIICVVLHLFSKARWRENRTIFNTPNPRLMNVSLLREKKMERRGSREGSVKGPPSREPSMASLRQHSPSIESKNVRRESRGLTSNGSAKSPTSRAPSGAICCDTPLVNDK